MADDEDIEKLKSILKSREDGSNIEIVSDIAESQPKGIRNVNLIHRRITFGLIVTVAALGFPDI